VERHQNDPFAMLGINTDEDKDAYRKKAAEKELNWRDVWAGGAFGPIPSEWGVRIYPTNYVLDHEGRIRHKNVHGDRLDKIVAGLIAEAKAAQ